MGAKKGVITFLAVLLVIAIMTATALVGLNLGFTQIPSVSEGIKLSLDLVGGSVITFEADIPAGTNIDNLDANMQVAMTMLRTRLTNFGFTEAELSRVGDKRLRVEIPSIDDPEEAVKLLGPTAKLEFQDADGNVLLSGSDLESSKPVEVPTQNQLSKQWVVEMKFKPDAIAKFAEATRNAAARAAEGKNYISIVMDGKIQSSPTVREEINSESAVIEFGGTASNESQRKQAVELSQLINIGQLPFDLKQVELRAIGPSLGEKSLETSLFAGFAGLCIVIVFMIVVYRLPGLVASIALAFYTALVCIVLAGAQINLSLPGIAGIILSIGMAVDSNIIIYERIKEELRAGKTLRSSIDAGFNRALAAVIDTHVTTLLAAGVLWWQGAGPIVGFAIVLFIGVLLSMFTVLVVSRLLLQGLVDMNVKSLWAYGI